jgi:lipid A 3-O-deacylase
LKTYRDYVFVSATAKGRYMNGILAVLFVILGPAQMWTQYCDTGCLARGSADGGLQLNVNRTIFQGDWIGSELYARYDLGHRYGPFQPVFGASVTQSGDIWIGNGAAVEWSIGRRDQAFVELSLLPGFYQQGSGPDLGGLLEARSGIAVGYAFANGGTLALSFDHRSNADIYRTNPGLETFGLRYKIQF